MGHKRSSFTGNIGFVLAAAGSAVGLGNLWRFPYLAAKNGGGVFILIYIILALTFGFALMTTEIAIGRKTQSSPVNAYESLNSKFKVLGYIASAVPFIIFTYYCVIGGWVTKYMADFIVGNGTATVSDGYFSAFISSQWSPVIWTFIFMFITSAVVFVGVEKGIEKFSKVLMPLLFVLIIGITIFSSTIKGPYGTALEGLKIYFIPNFEGMTVSRLFNITIDAVSQLFYSMSIAMGILITYGSYMKKNSSIVKSVNQIEICDTGVALLAGMIMIPVVYAFQGFEGLEKSGPSLLFVSLPKIFEAMGAIGTYVGIAFFVLVVFAALTSSISLLEAMVSVAMDKFSWGRKKAVAIFFVFSVVIALVICFGYNVFYFEYTLPNGVKGQLLDIFDYISNNILMPVVALLTCILVGWIIKPKTIIDEVRLNGEKFSREKLYVIMIKYIAPIFLVLIFLSSFIKF